MARKDAKSAAAKAAAQAQATKSNNSNVNSSSVSSSVVAQQLSLLDELTQSIKTSYTTYLKELENDKQLQLIDYFLLFLVALGALQFVYCLLVGNFPFNAFLGGFISTVGQFVLTVSLRLQTYNTGLFKSVSKERALGDFIFSSLVLHFIVYHFIN